MIHNDDGKAKLMILSKTPFDLEKHNLTLKFAHTFPIISQDSLEEIIYLVEKSSWVTDDKFRNEYYCYLMSNSHSLPVMGSQSGSMMNLSLKNNESFTIPGIDGKYRFMFWGHERDGKNETVIESENFLEILGLENPHVYIVEAAEQKKKSFFDERPNKIDIQDYRY